MMLIRRRTSAVVMEATPAAAGCCRCAAANPGRIAKRRTKRERIVVASRAKWDRKLTRPTVRDYGRARFLTSPIQGLRRSEERREGKSVDLGGRRSVKKEKSARSVCR